MLTFLISLVFCEVLGSEVALDLRLLVVVPPNDVGVLENRQTPTIVIILKEGETTTVKKHKLHTKVRETRSGGPYNSVLIW